LWAAIDAIAEHNGLSPSALARQAGLSSTAFNKSKRVTSDGRPRWPSTESIAKILEATGAGLADLARLIGERGAAPAGAFAASTGDAPIGFAEETPDGTPAVRFPAPVEAGCFFHTIPDEAAAPLYRAGDVLIASTAARVRRGDRVLVHTHDGGTAVWLFIARNGRSSEFAPPSGRRRRLRLASADVLWIARILWASQ
jgi:phage repressor protein C with HTH and peptisase S24 domain